jgi:hypothetical protein
MGCFGSDKYDIYSVEVKGIPDSLYLTFNHLSWNILRDKGIIKGIGGCLERSEVVFISLVCQAFLSATLWMLIELAVVVTPGHPAMDHMIECVMSSSRLVTPEP